MARGRRDGPAPGRRTRRYTVAMHMRLPESGSLIASVAAGLGHATADGTGIAVDAVTEPQLVEALDALVRGDIEYVIVEDGDAFLQAAGEGAGRYTLQYSPASGDGMVEVPAASTGRECGRAPGLSPRRGRLARRPSRGRRCDPFAGVLFVKRSFWWPSPSSSWPVSASLCWPATS